MIEPDGFDRLYAAEADPFGVATRWYERRKQAVVLASLRQEHYRLAWDVAAGTGHLGLALVEAGRCEQLLATDVSAEAVSLTRALLGDRPAAQAAQSALPDVPDLARRADLTLVTEVLFYLSDDDRAATLAALGRQDGEIVAVHWRHHPHDAHLSGRAATDELGDALALAGWSLRVQHDDTDFVLAGWVRRSGA